MENKKLFIFLLIILFIPNSGIFAQGVVGQNYKLITERAFTPIEIDGTEKASSRLVASRVIIPKTSKFKIIAVNEEGYIIRFWNWNHSDNDSLLNAKRNVMQLRMEDRIVSPEDNDEKYLTINTDINNDYNYYLIPAVEFASLAEEIVPMMEPVYGVNTVPFKLRFDNGFDFSTDVTLGGSVGIKFNVAPKYDFSINVLLGIGVSKVNLDSANTRGFITSSSDRPAFTGFGTIVFEWKRVQLGITAGGDLLSKRNIDNWDSQGKPWLGLGLGFSIFDFKSPAKEGKNH